MAARAGRKVATKAEGKVGMTGGTVAMPDEMARNRRERVAARATSARSFESKSDSVKPQRGSAGMWVVPD